MPNQTTPRLVNNGKQADASFRREKQIYRSPVYGSLQKKKNASNGGWTEHFDLELFCRSESIKNFRNRQSRPIPTGLVCFIL